MSSDATMLVNIYSSPNSALIIFYLLFMILILIVFVTLESLYLNYKIEREKRNEFLSRAKDDFEIQIRQEILSILVPKFVKDQLNQGNRTMQQNQDMVVILFCDISDFDKMITIEGTKIVQLLDSLFRAFDGFCLKYGAQKIEVIFLFLCYHNFIYFQKLNSLILQLKKKINMIKKKNIYRQLEKHIWLLAGLKNVKLECLKKYCEQKKHGDWFF